MKRGVIRGGAWEERKVTGWNGVESGLPRPFKVQFFLGMKSPYGNLAMRNTKNCRFTLGIRIELPVTEYAPDKCRRFILLQIKIDQTVTRVTEVAFIKSLIEREEGDSPTLQEERDDLLILHPTLTNIIANLSDWDSPPTQ